MFTNFVIWPRIIFLCHPKMREQRRVRIFRESRQPTFSLSVRQSSYGIYSVVESHSHIRSLLPLKTVVLNFHSEYSRSREKQTGAEELAFTLNRLDDQIIYLIYLTSLATLVPKCFYLIYVWECDHLTLCGKVSQEAI